MVGLAVTIVLVSKSTWWWWLWWWGKQNGSPKLSASLLELAFSRSSGVLHCSQSLGRERGGGGVDGSFDLWGTGPAVLALLRWFSTTTHLSR